MDWKLTEAQGCIEEIVFEEGVALVPKDVVAKDLMTNPRWLAVM